MKKLYSGIVLLSLLVFASCEPNNPFNVGPVYDVEGNLAIDRVKIDDYLETAEIDSLYRIHDPSGVVVIVQEEGVGTRPSNGTVVYADYTGSLISDGSVFDTSIESIARDNDIFQENRDYITFSFVIGSGSVIQGWEIGFRRLRPGSKAVIIVPSPYGYRDQTSNEDIPANSVLRFDVDFKGID
ncbi:FKBP-type peptidyl-prolyl cis-trans isomerase [Algoriphagus sp. CAU 1675]|uniref:FKBP-type peptidyl-prolyl cis-trans isomerase n=1 Tax=Algoriphagus sp. CAU 1675 TaxID=3032597 RepID=UPI0023DA059E|nr:FKBP-type peptidyl-prolyl cis-trans isomerase [Algoriphagus sp. CAU 1675]MDF2156553.1 FKBP-type peptidyl-prolyl cis-trans isomerase [Algoriphagus sp. CAU 1675]